MKPLYPVLLLLAFCVNAAAQSTRKDAALQTHAEARMSAKLNLVSLIDPETPTIQPGIEVRVSKRLSGEFTAGIPAKIYSDVKNTDSTYNRYYKLKMELRYFPFERRAFYFAPEVSYISKERSEYNGVFKENDGDGVGYDYAEIDKSIIAVAFKAGVVVPFRKNNKWFLDIFTGIGPRFANTTINAVNRRPEHPGWMLWNSDREGSTGGIHFTMGLKIGRVLY